MKNKLRSLFVTVAMLSVCLSGVESMAQRWQPTPSDNASQKFTLEYYLSQGAPAGGFINYAQASGESCQSGEVSVTVSNPTYQYRDGRQLPLHGDADNNAANLFCRSKGLSFARNVIKAEGGKVLTLEAHGNTFEADGHHTTVSSLQCYVAINEPCKTFNKDITPKRY